MNRIVEPGNPLASGADINETLMRLSMQPAIALCRPVLAAACAQAFEHAEYYAPRSGHPAASGTVTPGETRLVFTRVFTRAQRRERHGSDNSCRYVRIRTMQIL